MKIKDTVAKSDNTLSIDKSKELTGIANILRLIDLVEEEQNYLQMLQTNGLKVTGAKKEIGNE
jgi:hypothetical protein